jgi:hypothetical protein
VNLGIFARFLMSNAFVRYLRAVGRSQGVVDQAGSIRDRGRRN